MAVENFGKFVRRMRDTGVVQLPVAVIDCSANPNYPAGFAGDVYRVTVAGKIGGASGPKVEVGDIVLCHTDSATGTHGSVGSNWIVQQTNLDPTLFLATDGSNAVLPTSDPGVAGRLWNDAGTVKVSAGP